MQKKRIDSKTIPYPHFVIDIHRPKVVTEDHMHGLYTIQNLINYHNILKEKKIIDV